jgi:hypothetical protein
MTGIVEEGRTEEEEKAVVLTETNELVLVPTKVVDVFVACHSRSHPRQSPTQRELVIAFSKLTAIELVLVVVTGSP